MLDGRDGDLITTNDIMRDVWQALDDDDDGVPDYRDSDLDGDGKEDVGWDRNEAAGHYRDGDTLQVPPVVSSTVSIVVSSIA